MPAWPKAGSDEEGREGDARRPSRSTILVVDEGSLASTVQARDLLRIANALRIPRVVLVGDAKQLDAVDAGKPFAQLQAAGMQTATMDEIMRQRDPALKEAVEASLKGEIERAFEKLGSNVAEVKPDNIAGAPSLPAGSGSARKPARTPGVMAPSHELRRAINGHIRERLAREGRIHGPAMVSERLVSRRATPTRRRRSPPTTRRATSWRSTAPTSGSGSRRGTSAASWASITRARAVLLEPMARAATVAWKPGGDRRAPRRFSEVYRRPRRSR